jgi:hypothetical protein
MSVKTPFTSGKSSRAGPGSVYGMNRTTSEWRKVGKDPKKDDMYSCFSKSQGVREIRKARSTAKSMAHSGVKVNRNTG